MSNIANSAAHVFDKLSFRQPDAKKVDTTIAIKANEKSENYENKSGLTIMLEDFEEAATDLNHGNISLSEKNIDPGFINKHIFNKTSKDNIFRTDEAKEYIQNNPYIYRNTVFEMAEANDGGIKYANKEDDKYQSALNFAKADIALIEESYRMCGKGKKNGKIDIDETKHISTFDGFKSHDNEHGFYVSSYFESLDLDNDPKTISAEEYATYLLAIDGIGELGEAKNVVFFKNSLDGVITEQEAQYAANLSDETLHEIAQEVRDTYHTKEN